MADFAIYLQGHFQVLDVIDLIRGENVWAHRAKAIRPLAVQPVEELILRPLGPAFREGRAAGRDVVGDGVAGDVAAGRLWGDVLRPAADHDRQLHLVVDLAVVIGRRAKNVSPQAAGGYVAGYTIANDVSARSATFAEGRAKREKDEFFDWLHGKWPDGFCPMGPWLVTPEEVGDARDLELELTVNGKARQKASTSMMIFDVFEIVSFCSHLMTLLPGDVIATGTPSGVAAATGEYLRAGDVITCRIERIGELTNTLGAAPQSYYTPCRT